MTVSIPETSAGRKVLASAANGFASFLGTMGGNCASVLGRAGVAEHDISNPRLALDLGAYCTMMELAAQETRHDNFGLWFGQQFQPEMLGLIGEATLSAPTLGAALETLAGLFPFHQQATHTRLGRDCGLLRLEYRILDGRIVQRRQDAELTMGMFVNVLRRALGAQWTPDEVHFEHATPEAPQEHERAFGAPAHFGQPCNALVFRAPDLERRMKDGNLDRWSTLRAELVRLAGSKGGPSFLDRVKGEIRSQLSEGYPHIDAIADALEIPRWTLQRRLADHGVSFSEAVEQVRQDLARLYLAQRHIPLTDIAILLGYSELSAFSRAVKRWSGVSPKSMRDALGV